MDTILIEGYKKENYPKVVLLRSAEDAELLHKVENIVAVITWYDVPVNIREEYKSISYNRRRVVHRLVFTND